MAILSRIVSVVVLFLLVAGALAYHADKPRVLILQSYRPDYAWTAGVIDGLGRVTASWTDVHLKTHYMYSRKFSDEQALRRAIQQAKNAIDRWKPDVVIAFDNIAHFDVLRHYVDRDMSIVFAGINGPLPQEYLAAPNVAGILERRALASARDALLALEGEAAPWDGSRPVRVRYLHDASQSVLADQASIDAFDWGGIDYAGSVKLETFAEWQREVLRTASLADVIIVTNYRRLSQSGRGAGFVPAAEVLTWTERNAGVPVVGLNFFGTEDGATFSVGASPIEQGEVAARLARAFIDGAQPARTRVENVHFLISMSESRLSSKGLRLPKVYEAFSRATDTYQP